MSSTSTPSSLGYSDPEECSTRPTKWDAMGKAGYVPKQFDFFHLAPSCTHKGADGSVNTYFKVALNIPVVISLLLSLVLLSLVMRRLISTLSSASP